MTKTVLPNTIVLLDFIVTHLTETTSVFKSNSTDATLFQSLLATPQAFEKNSSFKSSPPLVTYIQLLLLTTLSMFGGLYTTHIKHISVKKNQLSLSWSEHVSNQLTMGVNDRKFHRFLSQYSSKVLSQQKTSNILSSTFLYSVYMLLDKYQHDLMKSQEKINDIIKHPYTWENIGANIKKSDLFFIILSSLPTETLNMLYLHLQSYIPDDMTIKGAHTQSMNLRSFFQIPSSDPYFLLDKLKLHFNIFFYSNENKFRETIQEKTVDFVIEKINQPQIKEDIITHLMSTRDEQLQPRVSLFTVFTTHLSKLLDPFHKQSIEKARAS